MGKMFKSNGLYMEENHKWENCILSYETSQYYPRHDERRGGGRGLALKYTLLGQMKTKTALNCLLETTTVLSKFEWSALSHD